MVSSCGRNRDIRDTILNDKESYYFIDFENYPKGDRTLPIGIFDSGTGGLAVLNDILSYGLSGDSTGNGPGNGNGSVTGNITGADTASQAR